MNKKTIFIVLAVIIGVIGFMLLTKPKSQDANSSVSPSSHVEGKGSSGITLLEYGDYQCPYCQQYHSVVKAVQEQFNDTIFFQFRNFPLESLHKNARAAARAVEAADLQNAFWGMHNLIYENGDPNGVTGWVASSDPLSFFSDYAEQLGLDVAKFKEDFASSQVNDVINADIADANKLGITGTPTFYLDGKKMDPAPASVDEFAKVINDAIAAKQQ